MPVMQSAAAGAMPDAVCGDRARCASRWFLWSIAPSSFSSTIHCGVEQLQLFPRLPYTQPMPPAQPQGCLSNAVTGKFHRRCYGVNVIASLFDFTTPAEIGLLRSSCTKYLPGTVMS